MLRKKITRRVITILLILFILIVVVVCGLGVIIHKAGIAARTAGDIHHVIASYIRQNHGDFPTSEADLVRQLLIRKSKIGENYEYFIRSAFFNPQHPEDENGWIKLGDFDLFTIFYGAQAQNIEMIDGKLYDKSSNKQILLINGPYKRHLRTTQYEPISVRWYELMLKEKQKEQRERRQESESN